MSTSRYTIFLDVDGVLALSTSDLCSRPGDVWPSGAPAPLSGAALARLAALVRDCVPAGGDHLPSAPARLVTSSDWRPDVRDALPALLGALRDVGVPDESLSGCTPVSGADRGMSAARRRVEEILAWLEESGYGNEGASSVDATESAGGNWVALDDMDLASAAPPSLARRFVRTREAEGLTEGKVAEALAVLRVGGGDALNDGGVDSGVARSGGVVTRVDAATAVGRSQRLWCPHSDCLESLESFPTEAALSGHQAEAHGGAR